ncbi:uncharacterized protein LOC135944163 [Cloeon dipterum]|uniref:uncharacterized protein LOC135944163 n=1 Tax=Cloeon dipterum TaxID=197152 RepID=UPI00322023D9
MTPVVHQIWARKIELDISQSLNDDQLIEVQYKEEHTAKWKTNSYQKSMGGRLILNFLKPKTLYAIRFVQKTFNHTSIKSKEIEARTKPCLPIDEKTLEMKFEAPFTAVARVKADLDEKENLCRLAKIQVISDKLMLLDTRVYDSELRWDLSPCHIGSQYLFRLEDEQGNVVQTNGTCAEGVEVVANKPSDITDSQQIFEMVFTGTVLLLMLSIICFYGTCICCEKRRRARQLAEEERQEIQRRYMSQVYVY